MKINITTFKVLRMFIAGAFLLAVTLSALSYPGGITGVTAPTAGCTCHGSASGGTTVTLSSQSGNFTVNPSSSANFTITVAHSSQLAGGVDIAVKTSSSGETNIGTLSPGSGSGLQSSSNELTHSSAKDFTSGSVSFDFSWTAPSTPGIYYMRAAGNAVNKANGNSGDFWNFASTQQVTVPGVSVLTANGGESLCPGASYNITWDAVGITNVKIELSTNGGSDFSTVLIASTSASAESWSWNIPSDLTPGNQYKLRISDVSDANRNDVSNGNFSIAVPTSITTHPASQDVCTKQNISFNVAAEGGSLTYQWRKNGSNLIGKTSATLAINNVQLSDAGNYDCVVSGACGSPVTSQAATLGVTETPTITTHPVSQEKCPGEDVTMSVTASATDIAYQWRKNSTDIPGANEATLTITNIQANDAGTYSIRVSGSCEPSAISGNATLTVFSAPSVSSQPENTTVCEGTTAQFSVTATGQNLTYQWRKDAVNIPEATASNYILNDPSKDDEGDYDVVVSGPCSTSTKSNKATLTINQVALISTEPEDKTASVGQKVTFSLVATGVITGYQWRKDSQNISGATGTNYTIQSVTLADSGLYDCIVTNSCGDITSSQAKLTVTENKLGPAITLLQDQIDFGIVKVNNSFESSFEALITNSGDETLSINSMNLSGDNSSEFSLPVGSGAIEIEPGESIDLAITFSPVSGGNKMASLNFESNAVNDESIELSGFGGIVELTLSATNLDFGDVEIGTNVAKEITITNNGNYDVEFSEVNISGQNSSDFSTDDITVPFTLMASGDAKVISISFGTTVEGQSNATLELVNNVDEETVVKLTANSVVSSVDDILFNSIAIVFPNPSSGIVIFKIERDINDIQSLKIIDNLGNVIKTIDKNSISNSKSFEWDGNDDNGNICSNGYYTLIMSGMKNVKTFPFVITR